MLETEPRRVLFLDIDGTVRKSPNSKGKFVNRPQDVEIYPEVPKILKWFKDNNWLICGASNQGGIAKGLVTEENVKAAFQETNAQCGGMFDTIVYCKHHPEAEDPEKQSCHCRKPRAGLVQMGASKLVKLYPNAWIPLNACLFVGDQLVDKGCAEMAGLTFIWAEDWRGGEWKKVLEDQDKDEQ